MPILELFQQAPWSFTATAFLLGLCIGSFLNVVIYRLPIMMKREWEQQCAELREESLPERPPFNLITPNSRCPTCEKPIRPWENIPVLSYLFLRGRCSCREKAISIEYPLVELFTGIASAVIAWHFGFGNQAIFALFLTWALIALSVIDFHHFLLPDDITQPFLWLGLLLGLFGVFVDLETAVIGAIAGYLSLWSVYWAFKLVTGKEGMGYGDFKLLALLGAWLGWQALPTIIILSSMVGAVIGILLVLLKRQESSHPLPFGPFLAAAGWLSLLGGGDWLNLFP